MSLGRKKPVFRPLKHRSMRHIYRNVDGIMKTLTVQMERIQKSAKVTKKHIVSPRLSILLYVVYDHLLSIQLIFRRK